jgi:hypothetical protein
MPARRPYDPNRVFDVAIDAGKRAGSFNRETFSGNSATAQKHAKELIGTSPEPDFTPPADRYVEPGHVLLEWLGQSSPYLDQRIEWAKRSGMLPQAVVLILDAMKNGQIPRVDGVSRRIITPAEGYSTTYVWGAQPGTYIVPVLYRDADRIFSSPSAAEWEPVGRDVIETPRFDPIEKLIPPDLRGRVRAIEIESGETEKLVGQLRKNPRLWLYETAGS